MCSRWREQVPDVQTSCSNGKSIKLASVTPTEREKEIGPGLGPWGWVTQGLGPQTGFGVLFSGQWEAVGRFYEGDGRIRCTYLRGHSSVAGRMDWKGRERQSRGTREDDGSDKGGGCGRGSQGQSRMWVEGCMGSVSVSVREGGSQKDPNFVAHG